MGKILLQKSGGAPTQLPRKWGVVTVLGNGQEPWGCGTEGHRGSGTVG